MVEDADYPGATYLECQGPQVGASCHRESECDIACSCDGDAPLSPTQDHHGPPDGTAGVTGHCSGRLQRGVLMCRLDASGQVTHIIVD